MSNLTVGSSPGRGMRLNLPIVIVPLSRTDYWILDFQPPAAYLGDEQMLRILGRGRSVPTVTELIFVRAQCFTNFAIKAFCTLRNNNWISILLLKHFALCGTKLDPVIVPQSAKCFNGKIGKTLRSHTDPPP
jgi:hypothetical protein